MDQIFRVVSWNIHKGVSGVGPLRRLQIHDIARAVMDFEADVVCLQEVRKEHRREARRFAHWPAQPQADFLAPTGYEAVYRTNAYTRHGEHGNALLTRWPVHAHQHEDMSDHRFEQRGLLHVAVHVQERPVHVIVVHLGLIPGSRMRQVRQLRQYIRREVPQDEILMVAGDFNESGRGLQEALQQEGLHEMGTGLHHTFPSRLPLMQLDHVFARGMLPISMRVLHGAPWRKLSDHLPLMAEFVFVDAVQITSPRVQGVSLDRAPLR